MLDQAVENAQRFVDTLNFRADMLRQSGERDLAMSDQFRNLALELDGEIRKGLDAQG